MEVSYFVLMCLTLSSLVHSTLHDRENGIAKTIEEQNKMEEQLRSSFNKLFSAYKKNSTSYKSYVMYVYDKSCNHSYEHGLAGAFLLAVLSERKFVIDPIRSIPFYHKVYDLNNGDWQIDESMFIHKSTRPVFHPTYTKAERVTEVHRIQTLFETIDFEKHFTSDIMIVSGDNSIIQDLRRHPRTSSKLPWLYQTHVSDFIRLVHNGLFRVKKRLVDWIESRLVGHVGDGNLICFAGSKKYMKRDNVKKWMSSYPNDNYRLYFSDDDNYIHDYDFIDEMENKIVHLDIDSLLQSEMVTGYERINRDLFKRMVEIHVFKFCDVLVTTENSFGRLAAQLRRNSKNLFCYRNNTIIPCTRELVGGTFRTEDSMVQPVDKIYLCVRKVVKCTKN